jgi:non-specific serine/threonine protein kinase
MLASPGVESRYDTLEAALDWSFELLEPEHRRVFQRLTVFAGPFDLSAAEVVAGRGQAPILDTIKALVDASMLVPVRPASQATRYRLLETVRDYGMRRLHAGTEEQLARQAHAGHFLALVEEASDALDTGEFAAWVDRLRADYLDLREALGWWLEHQPRTRVLRLARTLFHLWMSTGDSREAGFWGERMLEGAQSEPSSIRAGGHHLVGFSANMRGDAEVAVAHADLSVHLYRSAGDRVGLATALFGSGNVALLMGDPERAAALAGEILTICDETGGRWSRAGALSILAFVHWARGSLDEARRYSEEAAAIYGELGDIAGQVVMCPVGAIALEQGELRVAESYANQAVVVAIGTAWEGAALVLVAQVLLARGEEDAAEPVARLGMTRALDAGVELWFRRALLALARVHAARGSAELAATLLGASGRNAFGTELDAGPIAFVENLCRSKLGDREFALARERGRGLSHAQLLDLVPPSRPAEAGSSVLGEQSPERLRSPR